MADVHARSEKPRLLSEVLREQTDWSLPDRLRTFRELVLQVLALHEQGRIHRAIGPDTVAIDLRGRPRLDPPVETVAFSDNWDPIKAPPQMASLGDLELPEDIEAAAAVLRGRGLAMDPRRIDIYQLGAVLCLLVTDQTVVAYMYDPAVAGAVPEPLRQVLRGALGEGEVPPLDTCEALLEELDAAASPARGDTAAFDSLPTPPGRAPDTLPFQRLGPFRIVGRIGQGGMGDVYKAIDESLGREVALKVLPRELTRSAEFVRRFRAEATAVAQLSHPNVVPIYSVGEDAGRHYFAMQLVEGRSLAEQLGETRRIAPAQTLEILKQCLAGLQAAHDRGLIHRDVKPGNILLDRRTGLAMLVDFGLVRVIGSGTRVTATGVIMGTVEYIAPEQARGEPVDGRADVYSLGVLAYEMLSGRLPFEADSAMAMIFQHAYEKPTPLWETAPDVPRPLVDIVGRMMAKRPDQRYASAADVLGDLRAFQAGRPVSAMTGIHPVSLSLDAPEVDVEPYLPAHLAPWLKPGWWPALQAKAISLFRARAPEFVKQMQNTEQHVDGAVAEYQRRHDKLARVVDEADQIAEELSQRRQSYLNAAQQAQENVAAAVADPEEEKAQRDLEHCRQAAEELAAQEEKFQEELADFRLRKAQAAAKLLELISQRDLLRARLGAARLQADLGAGGPRPRPRRLVRLVLAGAVALGSAVALTVSIRSVYRPQPVTQIESPAPSGTPRAGGTNPRQVSTTPPVYRGTDAHWKGKVPAHALNFGRAGMVAEFDLADLEPDWMSRGFTAELLVKFTGYTRSPRRLMGNLAPTTAGEPSAGWALMAVPVEEAEPPYEPPQPDPDDQFGGLVRTSWELWAKNIGDETSKQWRLAFDYAAGDGQVQRLIGPPFLPDKSWWRIQVRRPVDKNRIELILCKHWYFDRSTPGMITGPNPPLFWLGAPSGVQERGEVEIAGFELIHTNREEARKEVNTRPRDSRCVLLDFNLPGGDLVLDRSGWGHHGNLNPSSGGGTRPQWLLSPERLAMPYVKYAPEPGKTFVVEYGADMTVELLRTRGLLDLDGAFTLEIMLQDLISRGERVLLGNAVENHPAAVGSRWAGWSLQLAHVPSRGPCLHLQFPNGPDSRGSIITEPITSPSGWHHLAICNEPTRRQIYVDGKPLILKEDDQADEILDNWVPSPACLVIGPRPGVGHWPRRTNFGMLREIRVSSGRRYNTEFTPPERFERDDDTVALIDFSHNRGSLVPDLSHNRHSAYLVGTKWTEHDPPPIGTLE